MQAVSKIVAPKKEILKDIWLSFYPGAKIGVLGASGYTGSELVRLLLAAPMVAYGVSLPSTIENEMLPFILFTLPAGAWVDRLRRRPILIAGDVGRALAAL